MASTRATPRPTTSGSASSGSSSAPELRREVDRADRRLVGELREHLADHAVHVGLFVAEVVEQGLQGRVHDLQLRCRQLQAEGVVAGSDEVGGLARHVTKRTARAELSCLHMRDEATFRVKAGLAEMLKGGVIMDVVDAEQAKIAEAAGAAAVMALERVPADIRRDGGVARMSDPALVEGIKAVVTIPVMAKARIGHFAEAQVLEALGVDYVDESEVLTPAD